MRSALALGLVVLGVGGLFGQFSISSITPSSSVLGTNPVTILVNGGTFAAGNVILFDGAFRTTTLVSSTQLSATIPAADLTHGSHTVRVRVSIFNVNSTNTVTFTVNNPTPTITSMSPTSKIINGSGISMTIQGTNFMPGAIIRFNGTALTTNVLSSTLVAASLSASLFTTAGVVPVRVENLAPTVGPSASVNFTINNPAPTLTALSPNSVTAGSPSATLSLTGTGFQPASAVDLAGSPLAVTFVSSTSLSVEVPGSLLLSSGTRLITAVNAAPGGGTSGSLALTIVNPTPFLTTFNPNLITQTGNSVIMSLTGAGLVQESVVEVGPTPFVAVPTTLTGGVLLATLPPSITSVLGNRQVRIVNPAPGGGTTAAQNFTVVAAQPQITSISPAFIPAGTTAPVLTINGTGFHSACRVSVGTATGLVPTSVNSTQIVVTAPSSQFLSLGSVGVRVTNTLVGGQASNPRDVTVTASPPVITAVGSGGNALLCSQGGVISIAGTGFHPSVTAMIGTLPVPVTSQTSSLISITLPEFGINLPGTYNLVLTNPGPSPAIPAPLTFTNPPLLISNVSGVPIPTGVTEQLVTMSGFGICLQTQVWIDDQLMPANGPGMLIIDRTSTDLSFRIRGTYLQSLRTLRIKLVNPGPGGGESPFLAALVGSQAIVGLVPNSIPVMPAQSVPVSVNVQGLGFVSGTIVRVNGVVVPSTFVGSSLIVAQIGPGVPGVQLPNSLSVVVQHPNGTLFSNAIPLQVGSAPPLDNRGATRVTPPAPAPGELFAASVDAITPDETPFVLVAVLNPGPPTISNLATGFDVALGIAPGILVPLADSLGAFGPPSGQTLRLSVLIPSFGGPSQTLSSYSLENLQAPNPAVGLPFILQAAWLDLTSPIGIQITSISGPHTL